jgi:hypothetical protein
MRCAMFIIGAALLAATPVLVSAEPTSAGKTVVTPLQAGATAQPAIGERLDPSVFRCGPILAKDPATRDHIRDLYKQQFDLQQNTMAQLKELTARASTITDQDAMVALNRQGSQLKFDLMRGNMELGLEIARLNGDAPRVAEYELALDQLLHPEKYQPKPDPDAVARRARERAATTK